MLEPFFIWCFPVNCETFKNTYFEKPLGTAASKNQHLNYKFTEERSLLDFFYPFKPFGIKKFVMTR